MTPAVHIFLVRASVGDYRWNGVCVYVSHIMIFSVSRGIFLGLVVGKFYAQSRELLEASPFRLPFSVGCPA